VLCYARSLISLAIASLLALSSAAPSGARESGVVQPQLAPLSPAEQVRVEDANRFLKQLWHVRKDGVFANRFLGVLTWQNPFDVWITQEIFFEVRPDFVVEAGTFRGGSALLWATLLQQINPDARVITIDIQDKRAPLAQTHPLAKSKVDFLLGSSTDPGIVSEVKRRVKGKRAVVILDSLHTTEHVRAELEAYAPLVPVGSYIIVQDTRVGPGEAVHQFLAKRDDFVIDKSRERLLITNNFDGFLKRVKEPRSAESID
jgi:cephalosporin hydroxylase